MPATHGLSKTRAYRSWKSAKNRCYNTRDKKYPRYGGRGIYMEDAWRENFAQMYADKGECPPGCTLDRVDNDGPYSNANCRWATPRQQANNTRQNRRITFNGRTQTVAEWARELGYPMPALSLRLTRHGWSIEDALTTPIQPNKTLHLLKLTLHGKTHTLPEWARLRGWTTGALKARIRNGWPVEQALTAKMAAPRGRAHR